MFNCTEGFFDNRLHCISYNSPHSNLRICSSYWNELEILVNPMYFPMLFHDPLNDYLNFKKYEYLNAIANFNMAPNHLKSAKITLFILHPWDCMDILF